MQTRSLKSKQRSCRAAGANVTVTLLLIAALALLRIDVAVGRPDVRQSPFALELQPPLLEPTTDEAFNGNAKGDRAIDSYGNPIDALRPIDTPDGRKVVSAQGVQFEIPNYASGITEIRQPADDLLPPHIGELTTTATTTTTTTTKTTTRTTTAKSTAANGATASPTSSSNNNNNNNIEKQSQNTQATITSGLVAPPQPRSTNSNTSISFAATPIPITTPTRNHNHYHNHNHTHNHSHVEPLTTSSSAPVSDFVSNHVKRDSTAQKFVITAAGPKHAPPTFTLLTLNPQFPAPPTKAKESSSKRIDSIQTQTPSQLLVDAIAVAQPTFSDIDSTDSTSLAPAPQPATSLTPPNHESSTTATEVEVEQAQLIPLQHQEQLEQQEETAHAPQLASGTLPDYLLELQRQDPLIDGPVPWIPAPHGTPLSVIAWDLLPPLESAPEPPSEPLIITEQQPTKHVVGVEQPGSHNIRISLGSGQGLSPVAPTVGQVTSGQVAVVPLHQDGPEIHGTNAHVGNTTPRNAGRFPSRHRGTVHYSTTQSTQRPRSSSSTTTTSTTTTTRTPLTTRTTVPTTTTRSTTPRTTTARPISTTSSSIRSTTPLDPSTFYKLDNEEEYAYTLPPWLQEVTDPDLDVAVTFIVPTDNDQYNHTVAEDLEPPYEPFVDLNNIQLTPPPTAKTTTTSTTARTTSTTTTTTTTTRRPSSTSTTTTTTTTTKAPIFKAQQQQQQQQQPLQPQLITTTIHTAPAVQQYGGSTTTTTTAAPVDPNPFNSATLPPWLQDFDYPDVGPGVPYNPDNFKETPVATGHQQQQSGARFDAPISVPGQDATAAPIAADNQKVEYTKSDEGKVISTPINALRKDSQGSSVAPPTSAAATNTGKYTGGFGAPAGLLRPQNAGKPDIYVAGNEHDFSNTVKANRLRPGAAPAPTANTGRYTGGFGAPSGVLSPQNAPRPFQQTQTPVQAPSPTQSHSQATHSHPQVSGAASIHHQNRFGGPPGILVPFDNVQRTGEQ